MPNGWCFIKIKNIASLYNGDSINQDIKKAKYTNIDEGFNYIGTKDIGYDNQINYENGVKIPFNEPFKVCPKGKVLLCIEGGNAGNKIAISEENVCFGNKLLCFNTFSFEDTFLFIYLQSTIFRNVFKSKETGLIGGVSIPKIGDCYIPIPSQNEQLKIVKIVKVFLDKINSINRLFVDVENLKLKIKSRIITLGVQGKLLNTDDNYYSTKIASISSLLDESFYGDGNWVLSDNMEIDSKLKLIQLGNIGDGSYIDKKLKSVKNKYKTNNDCKYIHNGYLLINRLIANRMYACIFESELNNEYITSVDVCWVKPNKIINLHYLLYIMLSIDTQQQVLQKASGSTRKRISKKNLININFNYFEDLDVQQRIVASVEKTLKLLNY